jgi:hypothetical protein
MSPMASVLVVALQVGRAGAPEVSIEGFVVVPTAEEVRSEPGQRQNIHYYVRDTFPATQTIDRIVNVLGEHGWKAVVGDEVAPDESSSLDSGWDEVPREQGIGLRLWSARWVNDVGDEVTYSLVYSSPQMASGMEPAYLSVSAWFDTKESAARQRRWIEDQVAKAEKWQRPVVPKRAPCPTE